MQACIICVLDWWHSCCPGTIEFPKRRWRACVQSRLGRPAAAPERGWELLLTNINRPLLIATVLLLIACRYLVLALVKASHHGSLAILLSKCIRQGHLAQLLP